MYQNGRNEYGCPLHKQSGSAAVKDFDAIIAGLSPELRSAFVAERAARQAELESYLAGSVYPICAPEPDSARYNRQASDALILDSWMGWLRQKVGLLDIHETIQNFIPRIVAHQ
jgi:hypothetical protein